MPSAGVYEQVDWTISHSALYKVYRHLREFLQALALGAVLTLQALKVSANLSQLQLQLGVTTSGVK